MKICFLTHNLIQDNGLGVFSLRVINGITKALSCEALILTTKPAGFANERPILYPHWLRVFFSIPAIRRAIKECDVVHCLDAFPYGFLAAVASIGLKKKIIITGLGTAAIGPLYKPVLSSMLAVSYRKAAVVTTASAFMKEEIQKKMPDLRVELVSMGVDMKDFARPSDGKVNYDMSTYKPYILGVGALRWRKGYHFTIKSFAKVLKEFPDLHYVIAGRRYGDAYHERLVKLIDELKLQGKVHLIEDVNTREELNDVYHGAELFCLFSQNVNHDVEGFGLVFLEAAAAGLAVVGSKNCGIDDAVEDGKNGILVPTRSPDDFADVILTILRDGEMKTRMAEESLAYARSCTWEKIIRQYIDIYSKLL